MQPDYLVRSKIAQFPIKIHLSCKSRPLTPGSSYMTRGNFHGLRGEVAGAYITYINILFNPDLSPTFDLRAVVCTHL